MLKIKYKIKNSIKESSTLETSDYKIEKIEEGNRLKYVIVPKNEITLLSAFIKIDQLDGEIDWKLRKALNLIQKMDENDILYIYKVK